MYGCDPGRTLYLRRPVTISGRDFAAGDVLPWRELGVPWHKLVEWHKCQLISNHPHGDHAFAVSLQNPDGLRNDGPTIEEWVEARYLPEEYPPEGWAIVESPGLVQYRDSGTGPWDEVRVAQRRVQILEWRAEDLERAAEREASNARREAGLPEPVPESESVVEPEPVVEPEAATTEPAATAPVEAPPATPEEPPAALDEVSEVQAEATPEVVAEPTETSEEVQPETVPETPKAKNKRR